MVKQVLSVEMNPKTKEISYSKSPQRLRKEPPSTPRYFQALEGTVHWGASRSSQELPETHRNYQELAGTTRNYQELLKFVTIYHTVNRTCELRKHTTARRGHFQLQGYPLHK